MSAEKKITVTIFVGGRKNCDCKVEKCEKTCFKISGANGVLDIYLDIFKSSRICYFLRESVVFHVFVVFNLLRLIMLIVLFLKRIFLGEKYPNIIHQWIKTWRFGFLSFYSFLNGIFLAEKSFEQI